MFQLAKFFSFRFPVGRGIDRRVDSSPCRFVMLNVPFCSAEASSKCTLHKSLHSLTLYCRRRNSG
eukprot:jgi/Botrbrau1/13558/Bobra.4_2s0016.1